MKILITQHIPDAGLALLREHDIEMHVLNKKNVRKSALIAVLKKEAYDGMITLLTDTIDEEVLDAVGTQMKVIANYAVGFNNIAVQKARERGITVTNTQGY